MAALVVCLLASAQPPSAHYPVLQSIKEVQALTNDEAAKEHPFHLRAQVTASVPKAYWLFLQEGDTGIYASGLDDSIMLNAGDWIEADGVTALGGFAPNLQLQKVKIVGHGPLPPAFEAGRSVPPEAANIWAKVQGRIIRVDFLSNAHYGALSFQLQMDGNKRMTIMMGSAEGCDRAGLVNADVSIHGVLGIMSAGAQNRKGDAMFVSSCQNIDVTTKAQQDWSVPKVDIKRLLTYRSGTKVDDMVRISGVVTLVRASGKFFLQRGANGILVDPVEEGAHPKVGDSLEALGRIQQDENGTRSLVVARLRPASSAEHFTVSHLKSEDFENPWFAGSMVTTEVVVVSREITPHQAILVGSSFGWTPTIQVPLQAGSSLEDFPDVGDRVEVTGIANIGNDLDKRLFEVRFECVSATAVKVKAKRPIVERVSWGRISLLPILLTCGAFFWVSTLRNRVQARTRQLEEANRQAELARSQAEQASRAKGEFLANMSHEIRTPMNGILGMTEATLETPLSSEQRDLIETAHSSAESLLTIINDILDFSKIEAGKLQLDPITFPLRKMLSKRLKVHSGMASSKGLKLLCEVADNVPNTIVSDPGRISQIITNLIGNAIKFTSSGSVVLKVELEDITGDTGRFHFSVRDTGVGIPKDKQQKIFEAFSQADASTTRKFGGTGLGLTISSKLVEMLGGKIWVESEEGKGSCFHFTLLAQVIDVAPDVAPAPTQISPKEPAQQIGLRILLVEDNPVNQKVAQRLLQKQGHLVAVAGNGKIAFETWQRDPFDLILMDIQMPEMDGIEATRMIRKHEEGTGRHIPIIALTAHAMTGDRERCIEAGMDGYASKPIRPEELRQEIERLRFVPVSKPAA